MINAIVCWFDATSGEGMVITESGEHLYINFTAIEGINKNNWHYPTLEDQSKLKGLEGRTCVVDVYRNLYSAMIEKAVLT